MQNSMNLPLSLKQIENYLAKGSKASPDDLKAAQLAYNTIIETIYGGTDIARCSGVKSVFKPFSF
jgi:hypothetical protein